MISIHFLTIAGNPREMAMLHVAMASKGMISGVKHVWTISGVNHIGTIPVGTSYDGTTLDGIRHEGTTPDGSRREEKMSDETMRNKMISDGIICRPRVWTISDMPTQAETMFAVVLVLEEKIQSSPQCLQDLRVIVTVIGI
jgi:hypothetical protein